MKSLHHPRVSRSLSRKLRPAAVLLIALSAFQGVDAADITKLDNTNALNLTTSWSGGVVPGSADTIVSSSLSATRSANLGGSLSVLGFNHSVTGTTDFQINGTPVTETLTIGSGGITKANSSSALIFNAVPIILGANQTWSIGSGTRNLQLNTTSFTTNGNTLAVSGAGTFDLRPTGTLNLGSDVTISTNVNVNSAAAAVTFGGSNTITTLQIVSGKASGSTLNNFGVASNFGSGGTNTAIVLGGTNSSGTFEYTGNSGSSNRTFNMDRRSNGNSILASTAGQTLTLTGTIQNSAGNATGEKAVTLTVGGAGNLVLNGVISNHSNAGLGTALSKTGTGSVTLGASNTFANGVTVSAGTLFVENTTGSGTGSGTVTVQTGGTLGGNGTIGGSVTFNSGSKFAFSTTSVLDVNGATVSFGNFSVSDLSGLTGSVAAGAYTLIAGSATISATNLLNVGSANAFSLSAEKNAYFDLSTGDLQVVVAAAIPEPATYSAVLGLGVIALAAARRRRSAA